MLMSLHENVTVDAIIPVPSCPVRSTRLNPHPARHGLTNISTSSESVSPGCGYWTPAAAAVEVVKSSAFHTSFFYTDGLSAGIHICHCHIVYERCRSVRSSQAYLCFFIIASPPVVLPCSKDFASWPLQTPGTGSHNASIISSCYQCLGMFAFTDGSGVQ